MVSKANFLAYIIRTNIKPFSFAFILFLSFLTIILVGCREKEVKDTLDSEQISPTKQKFLDSLNATPSIEVENGQAVVIKIPEGYLFVVPTTFGLFKGGKYNVVFSETGDFRKDGKIVLNGSWGETLDTSFKFKGHSVYFQGGSKCSIFVGLSEFEKPNTTAISRFNGTDPNSVVISDIQFIEHPGFNDELFDKFLDEEIKRIKSEK